MQLKVKRVDPSVSSLPTRAHASDAGLDLYASVEVGIPPGEARLISTGLIIELPGGTEGQVRPRSGLALKHSVTVLNAPGTIDEGYRGEVGVILINHGHNGFNVHRGMKVAQLVVKPTLLVEVTETTFTTESARGGAGFGSTGT